MVKGFDSSKTDPSKIFLDYIFSWFQPNYSPLTPEKANVLVKQWIKNSTKTSWVYSQFEKMATKPKITINRRCQKSLFSNAPQNSDSYFGAYTNQQQINICLNYIRNKIELKQNLDRELYTLYHQNIVGEQANNKEVHKQKERILMQSLYQGCQQGYRNYGWQEQTTRRVSKKCAVYLFRRRVHSDLPPDSLFRFASRLAQQVCL